MINIEQTIISQYQNSPIIMALIETFNECVDPSVDIDNFYEWVFNVETAQGFGLDIWGRIVGVTRSIPTTPQTILTDTQFRNLIMLKALANISIASSPAINNLLLNWQGPGSRCYVIDLGKMQILYTFEFLLETFEVAIITLMRIFLQPAGVQGFLLTRTFPIFGFSEGGTRAYTGFGQAPFFGGLLAVN